VHHFDHRFSTYRGATQAQLNKGDTATPDRLRPRRSIARPDAALLDR